jgi:hypothetical protein
MTFKRSRVLCHYCPPAFPAPEATEATFAVVGKTCRPGTVSDLARPGEGAAEAIVAGFTVCLLLSIQ